MDIEPYPLPNRLKFAHFQFLHESLQEERVRVGRGLNMLDVGCGPGNLALFCGTPEGSKWFGLDLWTHQLAQAAEKGRYEQLFQVNLFEGLPVRSSAFDVVICNEVLMYLPNAADLTREFHRVLAPGGKVFVYNPISWMPQTMARLKALVRSLHQERETVIFGTQDDWKTARRACRVTYYTLESLIREVAAPGFAISQVTAFRVFRNRIRLMVALEDSPLYHRIIRAIASRWPVLASDVLIVGTKSSTAT